MYFTSCIVCLLIAFSCLAILRQSGHTLLSPIGVFVAMFANVYFFVPALQELYGIHILAGQFNYQATQMTENAAIAMAYLLTCLGAFLLGNPKVQERAILRAAARSPAPTEGGMVATFIVVEGVAIVATVIYLAGQTFINYGAFLADRITILAGLGYLVSPILLAVPAALLIAVPYFASGRLPPKSKIWTALIALGANLVVSLAFGERLMGLFGFFCLAVAWMLLQDKRPNLLTAGVAAVGIVLLIATLGNIRTRMMNGENIDFDSDIDAKNNAEGVVSELAMNFGHAELLAIVRQNEGSWEPALGQTYAAALALPVPRVLWAEKPLGGGPRLANIVYVGSYDINHNHRGSMTTGCVLEAYLNGRIPGVLLVAAIHGLILGWVTRYGRRIRHRYQLVVYLFMIMTFSQYLIYGEFVGVVANLLIMIAPIFIYNKSRRRPISSCGRSAFSVQSRLSSRLAGC